MPPPSEEPGRSINPGSLEQFEAISDGFLVLDRDWRFVFINAAGERIFGRSRDDMIGRRVTEVVPEAVGSDFTAAVARVMATGEPVLHEAYFAPWDRWMENRVYPTPEGVWIFFRDVTERKRAVEELRESRERLRLLSTHLLTAREEERGALAREIHDELGQLLTALKIDLTRLGRDAGGASAAAVRTRIDAMLKLVDQGVDAVRRIAAHLRPAVLDDLGLAAAAEWEARQFERRTGIPCRLHVTMDDAGVEPQVATALFRILQEALTNVACHARATQVSVRLARTDDWINLTVEDDGVGLSSGAITGPSFGLLGMRERAYLVGGRFELTSEQGRGTRVQVRVPVTVRDGPL